MNPITCGIGNQYFLYDADTIPIANAQLFDVEFHRSEGRLEGSAQGRGEAWFFTFNGGVFVLRHYRRGGWMQRLRDDRYLWLGLERTRAFREWRLLAQLTRSVFPVPVPLAARAVRQGLSYRADIVTHRIMSVHSLAKTLKTTAIDSEQWRLIGKIIRRFHDANIYHADLNAHNILINSRNEVYLIDFDKGKLRPKGHQWKVSNLHRLQRSLSKLRRMESVFNYTHGDFNDLEKGYASR